MPDKYDTQNYGTDMANLWGAGAGGRSTWGANGQQFSINPQIASIVQGITGGSSMSEVGAIEETLAKYAKPGTTQMGSNTPAWLQPIWSQLVSTFGISATGSGQVEAGVNGTGKDLTIQNVQGAMGAQYSSSNTYTSLTNLANQFFQNYLTQGQTSSSGYNPASPPSMSGSGFWMNPITGAISQSQPSDPGTWINVMTGAVVQNAGTAMSTLSMSDVAMYTVGLPGSAPQAVSANSSGLPTFSLNGGAVVGNGGGGGVGSSGGVSMTGNPEQVGPLNPLGNKYTRLGSTAPSVAVTVNVQGSVTSENDLVAKIQAKIAEIMSSAQFAHNAALGGTAI